MTAGGYRKIIMLMRLDPLMPFNLRNYRRGEPVTFVGIVPGTALYIDVGALRDNAGNGDPAERMLSAAGLLATIVVVVLVARKARAKLREAGVDDRPAPRPGIRT